MCLCVRKQILDMGALLRNCDGPCRVEQLFRNVHGSHAAATTCQNSRSARNRSTAAADIEHLHPWPDRSSREKGRIHRRVQSFEVCLEGHPLVTKVRVPELPLRCVGFISQCRPP